MEEAGLLNTMTVAELVVTCERLQRSCKDMEMLLQEFQEEEAILRREQDRLHRRIDRTTLKLANGKGKKSKDLGFISSLLGSMELQLLSTEVSNIFKASEQRKASAKRQRWKTSSDVTSVGAQAETAQDEDLEACGPFSEPNVQISWGQDVALGLLKDLDRKDLQFAQLAAWVREAVCGDPVAEAEALPESAEMWAAQLAASGALMSSPQPGIGTLGFFGKEHASPEASPRPGEAPFPRRKSYGADGTCQEEDTTFETMVGSALGVVSQQVGEKFAVAQQVALQARKAAKNAGEGVGSGADPQAQFARRVHEAGAVLNFLSDWATSGGQQADASKADQASEFYDTVSFTVELKRSSEDQKWGLAWLKPGYLQNAERVLENCMPGTVADLWNQQQEQDGNPQRCIRPFDRLWSANGKTDRDQIGKEMAGTKVLLEFHRTVPRQLPEAADGASQAQRDQAQVFDSIPRTGRSKRDRSFQAAFGAYLQKKAPESFSPEKSAAAEHQQEPQEEEAAAAEADAEVTEEVDQPSPVAKIPNSRSEVLRQLEGELEEAAKETADSPAVPVKAEPYGLVAQVLSLGAGTVRISWLFDWSAAPSEISSQEWATKGFDVLRYSCETQEQGDAEEVSHCSKPPLNLELPVGKRYRFRVRASLRDSRKDSSEKSLWSSAESDSAFADFRSPIKPAWAQATSSTGTASTANGSLANCSSSASAASATNADSSKNEMTEDAKPATPQRVQSARPAGGVASKFSSFLAQRPAAAASASTASSAAAAEPSSPSSGSSPQKVVMGGSRPAAFVNPLASGTPRVISAGPLDPASEKMAMSERLRLRGGHSTLKVLSGDGLRPTSFDSDDEDSLAKICGALSRLEKTQAAAKQKEEAIAEEGKHQSLMRRLDSSGLEAPSSAAEAAPSSSSKEPSQAARSSAAAAAAAAAASGGWANVSSARGSTGDSASETQQRPQAQRLRVQLAESRSAVLEFKDEEDLPKRVDAFVATYGIKEACKKALLDRANELFKSCKEEETVDVVDLL
eukprot:TRINITY_DN11912_c0_g3_i1.p1 TRINITY_DN11912_c0_g3~~TRINITY_DN11912_c0_g3_i1.p1  ORF type:complete len:1026 (+),score=272.32 TRINITY_DN11912_c0_g3_i1:92-3169(+)